MAVWIKQVLVLSSQSTFSGSKSQYKRSVMYECGFCSPDVQAVATHLALRALQSKGSHKHSAMIQPQGGRPEEAQASHGSGLRASEL